MMIPIFLASYFGIALIAQVLIWTFAKDRYGCPDKSALPLAVLYLSVAWPWVAYTCIRAIIDGFKEGMQEAADERAKEEENTN